MDRPFIVTIIGAESTGKTTLSRDVSAHCDSEWVPEFARPYLETTCEDVTNDAMNAIWVGQRALQHEALKSQRPLIIQDTDLFATVGYWQLPHVTARLGSCPQRLIDDAVRLSSDLYLITQSVIPFEQDPLRFGGDVRESADSYWKELCDTYHLPCAVIHSSTRADRLDDALTIINERSLSCAAS